MHFSLKNFFEKNNFKKIAKHKGIKKISNLKMDLGGFFGKSKKTDKLPPNNIFSLSLSFQKWRVGKVL